MADTYYYPVDDSDCPDGDTSTNPDDLLPPIVRLHKYVHSDKPLDRLFIARNILDTLRQVADAPEDVEAVLKAMETLENDSESSVRTELMEQVPHIAMYCQEMKSNLARVMPDSLLPMVVMFLKDLDNQVRKTTQAALLVLLEQGLVDRDDVKEQVCPVIIRLTDSNSFDDFRTEAVALLSKMAPQIGKEMTEEIFLDRFATLCQDSLFHVRKVCAANFGDFSRVVGVESTEKVLLSKFLHLCADGVWGVRKACADVFMTVSCAMSAAIRRTEMSPVFVNLLNDDSRWVRMSAYQALGPFISTFADKTLTSLLYNDNGEIVISDRARLVERLEYLEQVRREEKEAEVEASSGPDQAEADAAVDGSSCSDSNENDCDDDSNNMDLTCDGDDDSDDDAVIVIHNTTENSLEEERAKAYADSHPDDSSSADSFNNFLYWRDPIPVLEDIPDQQQSGLSRDNPAQGVGTWTSCPVITFQTFDDLTDSSNATSVEWYKAAGAAGGYEFDPLTGSPAQKKLVADPALPKGPPLTVQHIVPQVLIDHFISMANASRAETVDSDIAHHCAFALPAVALTLGRSNWAQLRETYELLAIDMRWKVRRTLASSLHELGVMLGQEAVCRDLVPTFDGLIKDLDEVRIGLLVHLADFMGLLPDDRRSQYLPRLVEFLKLDNARNWRFREALAEQVGQLIPATPDPADIGQHLAPILLVLVTDRVAAVRLSAIYVYLVMVKALVGCEALSLVRDILTGLESELALSQLWTNRQTYAVLAGRLLECGVVSQFYFAQNVLPNLLKLATDHVPNVRMAVAKAMNMIRQKSFLMTDANPHLKQLVSAIGSLATDSDADVRAFIDVDELFDSDGEYVGDVSSLPV